MKLSNYENKTSQRLNVKSLSFEINRTNQKALPKVNYLCKQQ